MLRTSATSGQCPLLSHAPHVCGVRFVLCPRGNPIPHIQHVNLSLDAIRVWTLFFYSGKALASGVASKAPTSSSKCPLPSHAPHVVGYILFCARGGGLRWRFVCGAGADNNPSPHGAIYAKTSPPPDACIEIEKGPLQNKPIKNKRGLEPERVSKPRRLLYS